MQSKSNNIRIIFYYNDANKFLDELFESLFSGYYRNLETSIEGSKFIFDSLQLMYYKYK